MSNETNPQDLQQCVAFLESICPPESGDDLQAKVRSRLTQEPARALLRRVKEAIGPVPPLVGADPALVSLVEGTVYSSGRYYLRSDDGSYADGVDERGMLRLLKNAGARGKVEAGERLSQSEALLLEIHKHRSVDAVVNLALKKPGVHDINGRRVLVPRSLVRIDGVPGDATLLESLFKESLGDEQYPYFLGWLRHLYSAWEQGQNSPGQMLVFAGAPNSGKSLAIELIVRIFGGRRANVLRSLNGGTQFNRELAECIIHVIDDQCGDTSTKARACFAGEFKSRYFGGYTSLESKNQDAVTVPTLARLVVAVNDRPDAIRVLPKLTSDLHDKIMLLKWSRPQGGVIDQLKANHPDDRAAILEALLKHVPAFVNVIRTHVIKPEEANDRTGVAAYRNPELMELLECINSDSELEQVILQFAERCPCVTCTAAEFLRKIHAADPFFGERLLRNPQAPTLVGTVLYELSMEYPALVRRSGKRNKTTVWQVGKDT